MTEERNHTPQWSLKKILGNLVKGPRSETSSLKNKSESSQVLSRRRFLELMFGTGVTLTLGGIARYFSRTEQLELKDQEIKWEKNPEIISTILNSPKLLLFLEDRFSRATAYLGFDIYQLQPKIYTVLHAAREQLLYIGLEGEELIPLDTRNFITSLGSGKGDGSAAYEVSENNINYLAEHDVNIYIRAKELERPPFPSHYLITQNLLGNGWLALRIIRVTENTINFYVAGKIDGVSSSVIDQGVYPGMSGAPVIPVELSRQENGSYKIDSLATCGGKPISLGELQGILDESVHQSVYPGVAYEYKSLIIGSEDYPEMAGATGSTVGVINRSDDFLLRNF